jgi:hypothetical protein
VLGSVDTDDDPPGHVVKLGWHDHDRTRALVEDCACHRAEQERLEGTGTRAPDHEQVSRSGLANERVDPAAQCTAAAAASEPSNPTISRSCMFSA